MYHLLYLRPHAGCGALWNLAFSDANQTEIAGNGGIEAVVSAMRQHSADAGVQEEGCGALWNLAATKANESLIGSSGGVDVVIHAMTLHRSICGVGEQGLGALRNLAANDHNRMLIANADGVDTILQCLSAHLDNPGVAEEGCGALYSLAFTDANKVNRITPKSVRFGAEWRFPCLVQVSIAGYGGIPIVVAAMRKHLMHTGVQEQVD
jgi:hypothetical protein